MRDLQVILKINHVWVKPGSADLDAELPGGSDGNAGNGAVVIGGDDCALFSAAHTRTHTLNQS